MPGMTSLFDMMGITIDKEMIDKLNEGRWEYQPPITPHEKFYRFVKKNPMLLKLKEELDLEIDL